MNTRTTTDLRLITFKDPNAAIGVAVRFMMEHPAFARQPFGTWARVLDGQAKRGHHAFVVDATTQVRGHYGYAIVSTPDAAAWASGGRRQQTKNAPTATA